jgi:hypothetical protein
VRVLVLSNFVQLVSMCRFGYGLGVGLQEALRLPSPQLPLHRRGQASMIPDILASCSRAISSIGFQEGNFQRRTRHADIAGARFVKLNCGQKSFRW